MTIVPYNTILVYLLAVIEILTAVLLIRRRKARLAWLIICVAIGIDLGTCFLQEKAHITQPRGNINFSQYPSQFSLPTTRAEMTSMDTRFKLFRGALFEEYIALDYSPIRSSDILFANDFASLVNAIQNNRFPLQEEINTQSVLGFIIQGAQQYNNWSLEKQKAYIEIAGVCSSTFLLLKPFASNIPDTEARTLQLKKYIATGDKARMIELFIQLSASSPQLYQKVTVTNLLQEIYRNLNCRQASAFIRLKSFDTLARIFDNPNVTGEFSRTRAKLSADMGISRPIITFFTKAVFLNSDEYLRLLRKGDADPAILYLENNGKKAAAADHLRSSSRGQFTYHMLHYDPEHIILQYQAKESGFLYFSDGFDSHWSAKIDHIPTTIFKANGAFKAIQALPGEHLVEFRYVPVFFRLALWSYYILTLFCLGFLLFPIPKYIHIKG